MSAGPRLINKKSLAELPAVPQIEALVLSGILSSSEPNETFLRVCEMLGEHSFSIERNRVVFAAMRNAESNGLRISFAVLAEDLKRMQMISGSLSDLLSFPEITNLDSYCRIVQDAALRRRLFVKLDTLQNRVLSHDPLAEVTNSARQLLESAEFDPPTLAIEDIPSVHQYAINGIEFAVDRLIAMGAISALTGPPGSGKSTFATGAAGHVACGVEFLGRAVTQRRVVFLDRENPAAVVHERLQRLGIQDGGHLKIWGGWLSSEAPDPASNTLLKFVAGENPNKPLIVVDSFRAFLRGDENDATIVRAGMEGMRRLADAGAAVVLLHHPGKGESARDYRGSSDFLAAIDVGYSLVNLGDGQQLGRMRLRTFKSRFRVDGDLVLEYRDGQFVADYRPHAVAKTVTEQLTELLRHNAGITTTKFTDLADQNKLGRNAGREFLENGLKVGEIRREKGAKHTYRHFLTESATLDGLG